VLSAHHPHLVAVTVVNWDGAQAHTVDVVTQQLNARRGELVTAREVDPYLQPASARNQAPTVTSLTLRRLRISERKQLYRQVGPPGKAPAETPPPPTSPRGAYHALHISRNCEIKVAAGSVTQPILRGMVRTHQQSSTAQSLLRRTASHPCYRDASCRLGARMSPSRSPALSPNPVSSDFASKVQQDDEWREEVLHPPGVDALENPLAEAT